MALQRYSERRIYPSIWLKANEAQIGILVMQLDASLCLERKTNLDDGIVIYRHNLNDYHVVGTTFDSVYSDAIGMEVPSELDRFIKRAEVLNLNFEIVED